jgi:glucose-1-phosphate cytidylyltransferase
MESQLKPVLLQDIPVVILCGGEGSRFGKETENSPKPLLRVGPDPILVHIMHTYARHGFRRFILCLGYRGSMIKNYFLDRDILEQDLKLDLSAGTKEFLGGSNRLDWEITFAETGPKTETGGRIKRVENYIDTPMFMLTYGDGVADIDLKAQLNFHRAHGKIGTITGVQVNSQFGELVMQGDAVQAFREKPKLDAVINAGYFAFQREFLDYLSDDPECVLEREPLERIAADQQLNVWRHSGFWQNMDTFKDYQRLNELYTSGKAAWITDHR